VKAKASVVKIAALVGDCTSSFEGAPLPTDGSGKPVDANANCGTSNGVSHHRRVLQRRVCQGFLLSCENVANRDNGLGCFTVGPNGFELVCQYSFFLLPHISTRGCMDLRIATPTTWSTQTIPMQAQPYATGEHLCSGVFRSLQYKDVEAHPRRESLLREAQVFCLQTTMWLRDPR